MGGGGDACKMLPNKIGNEVSFLTWKLSLNANVINKHGLLYTWQCTFCIDVASHGLSLCIRQNDQLCDGLHWELDLR